MRHKEDENSAFDGMYKHECEQIDENERMLANSTPSRIIRFRGKTINNEWVHGNLIIIRKPYNNNKPGVYISSPHYPQLVDAVRPETVGQFTEQYDKNRTEIYEGDKVTENNDRPLVTVSYRWQSTEEVEIVGNIHG